MPAHENRAYLVTGANGAIGKAIATGLAKEPGAKVTLVCRNNKKGEETRKTIADQTDNPNLILENCGSIQKERDLCLSCQVDWTLTCVGEQCRYNSKKQDGNSRRAGNAIGNERHGIFLVDGSFSANSSKEWGCSCSQCGQLLAGDLELNDLGFQRRPYNNNQAYRQSKQADRMLTKAFAGGG